MIHVALGNTAFSEKISKQLLLTFCQLADLLTKTPVHVGKLTVAEYLALKVGSQVEKLRAAKDKDTAWFSLSYFMQPHRRAALVQKISGWVGDFDSGAFTAEQLSATVAGYKHIILTTYSHTPEVPKYRLIVPFSQAVSPAEYAELWKGFAALFDDQSDSSTRDTSRLWYLASCAIDQRQHQTVTVHDEGVLFEPYETASVADSDPLPQRDPALVGDVNDDLALISNFEKPSADDVARMLPFIKLEDAAGKRRAPWFKVLCGLHDWSEGSDEGFQLADAWSSTQPGYISSDDVRKTWDSCKRKGIGIGTVIQMAIEGGYVAHVDEETPPEQEQIAAPTEQEDDPDFAALNSGALSLKAQVRALKDQGNSSAASALLVLEEHLIYVADQQEYYSTDHNALVSKDAIKQLYKSQMLKSSNGKLMDPTKLLENSITKRVVSSMGYHPGEGQVYFEHGRPLANWHQPYIVEPLIPTPYELDLFKQLVAHLFPSRADGIFAKYMLQFFAHSVQKPGVKIGSAPLLFSRETGTGKTTMMYEVPVRLFGPLNCTVVSNEEVESQFSDFLSKKHLIHLDEIFMGGMRQAAAASNKFKPIVTNSTVKVHPKGFAGYDTTNRLIVTACSNYPNALHLTDFDRRWAVHEVKNGKMDKGFAAALYGFLEGHRGAGVLKHIFQNISIAGFNPHADAPMTAEKKAMIEASRTEDEAILKEAIDGQQTPFEKDVFAVDEVLSWMEQRTGKKLSARKLSDLLIAVAPKTRMVRRIRWGKARIYVWACRNVETWMKATPEELGRELGMQATVAEEMQDEAA